MVLERIEHLGRLIFWSQRLSHEAIMFDATKFGSNFLCVEMQFVVVNGADRSPPAALILHEQTAS